MIERRRAMPTRSMLALVVVGALRASTVQAQGRDLAYASASFYEGLTGYTDVSGLPSGISIKYVVNARSDEANGEQGLVTFAVKNANGVVWTGLGFNDNPGMFGGDFVVVTPGSAMATFRDMYNHKKPYEMPLDDDAFTITPIKAYKTSSSLEFQFSRPLVSCRVSGLDGTTPISKKRRKLLATTIDNTPQTIADPTNWLSGRQDVSIHAKEGIYLQYAWGSSATFAQHSSSNRGALFTHIVDSPTVNTVDVTSYVDVKPKIATNMQAGATFYACTKHDLGTAVRYVVGWDIINSNPTHLHHAQMYFCTDGTTANDPFTSDSNVNVQSMKDHGYSVNGGASTGNSSIGANDVTQCGSMDVRCAEVVASWAVGGTRVVFPDGTARKIGGSAPGDIRYVMIERHWNAGTSSTQTDDSGFRLFTQSTAPTVGEVGIFLGGIPAHNALTIGANGLYNHVANCPGACTTKMFGSRDMTMFAYFPHQHTAGRASFTRQIRNGVELPPITSTPFYDFDFQTMRWINGFNRTIKPGDDLVFECAYDTRGRSIATQMGEGTEQEMCFMFFMYYPKMDLFSCYDAQGLAGATKKTSCGAPGGLNSRTGFSSNPNDLLDNTITVTTEYENTQISTCASFPPASSPPVPPPPMAPPPMAPPTSGFPRGVSTTLVALMSCTLFILHT